MRTSITGRGLYSEYDRSLERLLPQITNEIEKNGILNVDIRDIAKELGKEFEYKGNTALYNGLKFVLFKKGIVVKPGSIRDTNGNLIKVFKMRKKTPDDKLPKSLEKLMELSNDNKPSGIESEIKIKKNNAVCKYHKYPDIINKSGFIPKLKSLLMEKDTVELDAEEVIKDMGFPKRKPKSILVGIRPILEKEGIKVRYHSSKTNTCWYRVFIFESAEKR